MLKNYNIISFSIGLNLYCYFSILYFRNSISNIFIFNVHYSYIFNLLGNS